MTKKLILFDIDGTLIVSGGAGARAMTRAFEETWGLSDALRHVDVAGRTDNIIMADALRATDIVAEGEPLERFKRVYCEFLREELRSESGASVSSATAREWAAEVRAAWHPAAAGRVVGARGCVDGAADG